MELVECQNVIMNGLVGLDREIDQCDKTWQSLVLQERV